jgi:OmpA-OmpF porin, OOP family
MGIFDALIDDMASRFGLGSNAAPLVREGLALITGGQGGIAGFLDRLRKSGLSSQVSSWLGPTSPQAFAAPDLERVIGGSALGGIASRLGLGQPLVTTALAYGVPKLIGLLAPNGVIPTTLPAEVTSFLAPLTAQVAPSSIHVHKSSTQTTQVPPKVEQPVKRDSGFPAWLWPLLGVLALLLIGWWLWPTLNPKPAETPTAQAPATAPAPLPAVLTLNNDNGVVSYSGAVHDDQARTSIVDALRGAFGADKIKGDIAVDANRAGAPWLAGLRGALDPLKVPGVEAAFQGAAVNIGGTVSDAVRQKIISSIKPALGTDIAVGSLAR